MGTEAAKVYASTPSGCWSRIVAGKSYTANAVIRLLALQCRGRRHPRSHRLGDEERSRILTAFHSLRQQLDKPAGQFDDALADYIAPRESGRIDYIGGFSDHPCRGHGVEALPPPTSAAEARRPIPPCTAQALGDRLAEAMAEMFHKLAREFCGFGRSENLSHEELIRERYRGVRPAPGYPACPDHMEKPILFDLLGATAATGITLTESCAMSPASSVSGSWYGFQPPGGRNISAWERSAWTRSKTMRS